MGSDRRGHGGLGGREQRGGGQGSGCGPPNVHIVMARII